MMWSATTSRTVEPTSLLLKRLMKQNSELFNENELDALVQNRILAGTL